MISRKLTVVVLFCAAIALSAAAQTGGTTQPAPAPEPKAQAAPAASGSTGSTPAYIRPETPQQRRERLGTEDPGLDPDPKKIYYRYGKQYHIEKFDRRWASYDTDPGFVRPFAFVNSAKEIYQQNDQYVWVWMEHKDEQAEATAPIEVTKVGNYDEPKYKYLRYIQPEFTPLYPEPINKRVVFEDSSEGLPTAGSWRNSATVADMNNDGFPDIIAPPQRGAAGLLPAIFLGDGKGHWKIWDTVVWPTGIQYGGVAAADFNKDGNMDLVFAVHLQGLRVWLGDGKGHFTNSSEGLPLTNYPTRRVVVADFDQDGWPDVMAISEGPTAADKNVTYGKAVAFLNRNKGAQWSALPASDPKAVFAGDWLAVGNFNKDKYPDFVGASIYFQASQIVHLSKERGKWEPLQSDGEVIPYLSYYLAMATGPISSKKVDDAVISFARFWPPDFDPNKVAAPAVPIVSGIERIAFSGAEPKRVPIMRWASNRGVTGLGIDDFDGDGNMDIAFTRFDPRELVLLLGDGKGGFRRAEVGGFTLEAKTNYDLKVADVNGDKRPDLIVMYESASETRFESQNGSIHVYLNRGVQAGNTTTAAK